MRMHRYRGKENGLMIIGSENELRTLGAALLKAADATTPSVPQGWPPQVAEIQITARRDFLVSFHREGPTGLTPKTNFP